MSISKSRFPSSIVIITIFVTLTNQSLTHQIHFGDEDGRIPSDEAGNQVQVGSTKWSGSSTNNRSSEKQWFGSSCNSDRECSYGLTCCQYGQLSGCCGSGNPYSQFICCYDGQYCCEYGTSCCLTKCCINGFYCSRPGVCTPNDGSISTPKSSALSIAFTFIVLKISSFW
jgi:hypothetical protein